nr:hypothetical protein [Micromonospora sp. DSM 115978]
MTTANVTTPQQAAPQQAAPQQTALAAQTAQAALEKVGVQPSPLSLLLLGHGADPDSERGVDCPGSLPAASDPGLVDRARAAKAALG